MRHGEIRYAKAGEHHVAFREFVGDEGGNHDIVMINAAFMPMEMLPEDPMAHRFLEGLAGLGRVIVFDRRGIGLSDPVTDWESAICGQWADDLAAVIAEAGCDSPTVFSWMPEPVARTCSIQYPGLIGRLVLFNPASPVTEADAQWVAQYLERGQRIRAGITDYVDEGPSPFPTRDHDPAFRAWWDAAGRAGASPAQAERLTEKSLSDVGFDNAQVTTPTLVLTRVPPGYEGPVPEEFFGRAAKQIPEAQHIVLPPGDMFPVVGGVDAIVAEISRFSTGEVRLPAPERQMAVILFTDLVGSTRKAASTGDAAWRRLLDRHDAVNRSAVTRRGGEVIKTTGDGVLALLPSATAAVDAAQTIRVQLRDEDLEVRVGIHLGEIDRRGEDVSGLAVNIAARIMSIAEPGQILTSALIAQTTDAAPFASLGTRTLKGLDGTWELFTVD
jgi:class 3 adenylate cyclase/pimeloyl-ACP methyl ester carboxylesterase